MVRTKANSVPATYRKGEASRRVVEGTGIPCTACLPAGDAGVPQPPRAPDWPSRPGSGGRPLHREEEAAGTGEGYSAVVDRGSRGFPLPAAGSGTLMRTLASKLGVRTSLPDSERPLVPLSAVVASRAPRKVLGSSVSTTNSTSLSSKKGKNRSPEESSLKGMRPGTTVLLTREPPDPP